MNDLFSNVKIKLPSSIYLKDPESSVLGKKIIEQSIILIAEIGFEDFNFKKLGKIINSNESSIYRYFESKHKLLIYLTSWYWSWVEYKLVIEIHSIHDSKDKLSKAIEVVTRRIKQDSDFSHINEVLLTEIIINENSKAYLTKDVDTENKEGYFMPYKRVVRRISEMISAYDYQYKYPLSLASTIMKGALHQQFIQLHFKSITNCDEEITATEFFIDLTFKTLSNGE